MAADFFALGGLEVLYPPIAVDVLGQDSSWTGYLNAAFGAGAALAIVATARLVGRARLMPSVLLGLGLYAGAFIVLTAYQTLPLAVVLLIFAGLGRATLGVGTRTLLQHVAPPDMLTRVFGVVEAISMGALALGSLSVAVLVAIGGVPLALLGIGCVLPLAVLGGGRSLFDVDRRADVPIVEIGLLRSLDLFAPLPADKLEALARHSSGERCIRETRSSPKERPVTASMSSLQVRSPSHRMARHFERSSAATASARSHSCTLYPGRRLARPAPTERCSASAATTSWAR